jgi:hypothetical protein
MNLVFNSIPVVAVVLGQADAPGSALSIYGPLGVICAWSMWRDEKRARENEKLRETISGMATEVRESLDGVAHEMRGVNLNFLLVQASHGPENLRGLAQAELERKQASDRR